MKLLATVFLGLSTSLASLSAQERIPPQKTAQYGLILTITAANEKDAQVKVDGDITKVSAIGTKNKQIVVFVPDRNFGPDSIAKASATTSIPVGQLWMSGITLKKEGKVIPKENLRVLNINAGKEKLKAPLCFVSLKKNGDGKPELLVYGKGKEAILMPLLDDHESEQLTPVEVDLEMEGEQPKEIALRVHGKHRVKLEVGPEVTPAK